jgi:hypothetical protein
LTLSLPAPVPAVIQFVVDHVERTTAQGKLKIQLPAALDRLLVEGGFKGDIGALALNTVVHRLSVLSKAHRIKDLPNPARDLAQNAVSEIRVVITRAGAADDIAIAKESSGP